MSLFNSCLDERLHIELQIVSVAIFTGIPKKTASDIFIFYLLFIYC